VTTPARKVKTCILPFWAAAAARYPGIVLTRRQAGNPIEKFDSLIAATALAAGASIAKRDTGGRAILRRSVGAKADWR
jgi:predicted nucleic acid-binding protein